MSKVNVTVLLQPEHRDQADRHFRAAKEALGLYGLWLGPYPYRQLTVVDPPFGGRAAGGMEYPQLITAGTRIDSPIETQSPEGVTLHEVGHQWFMNLLATNEAEEAWLDEGMNTYFTQVFLDLAYGQGWTPSKTRTRTDVVPASRSGNTLLAECGNGVFLGIKQAVTGFFFVG